MFCCKGQPVNRVILRFHFAFKSNCQNTSTSNYVKNPGPRLLFRRGVHEVDNSICDVFSLFFSYSCVVSKEEGISHYHARVVQSATNSMRNMFHYGSLGHIP